MRHTGQVQTGAPAPRPAISSRAERLAGTVDLPGDKSISHRALMLSSLAVGRTTISGLLESEDVLATACALNQLGASVRRLDDGEWVVDGVGVGGLRAPEDVLDVGNAGTAARLLLGILSTHNLRAVMTGDASLRKRPMARVTGPLAQMGARFDCTRGDLLPLTVWGAATPVPIEYAPPVASAQVKSAILLAGLNTMGATTVVERVATRDHTERMLRCFGCVVDEERTPERTRITVCGWQEMTAVDLAVPADPSSAAFVVAAALLAGDGAITAASVCLNPLRTGLFDILREMGADFHVKNVHEISGEPVGDIVCRSGPLRAVDVPAKHAASMIDEYPALAVVSATASGTTRFNGIGELRVKESDRLAVIADGLALCGVKVRTGADWMEIDGSGGHPVQGTGIAATVMTQLDHRIAMSFLVLGLASRDGVLVDDTAIIDTSFPGFVPLMQSLGAPIELSPI
ncbi:MAG: 3-phosphoshikimate 1-carboxyvinyltransferase [Rhodospirillaceae bacterium]|nr:3-phosphoshikimate 1-carboxyvinyltransferase [Rhodospirillaceae bacterium]